MEVVGFSETLMPSYRNKQCCIVEDVQLHGCRLENLRFPKQHYL
jgi:hypothetical protein